MEADRLADLVAERLSQQPEAVLKIVSGQMHGEGLRFCLEDVLSVQTLSLPNVDSTQARKLAVIIDSGGSDRPALSPMTPGKFLQTLRTAYGNYAIGASRDDNTQFQEIEAVISRPGVLVLGALDWLYSLADAHLREGLPSIESLPSGSPRQQNLPAEEQTVSPEKRRLELIDMLIMATGRRIDNAGGEVVVADYSVFGQKSTMLIASHTRDGTANLHAAVQIGVDIVQSSKDADIQQRFKKHVRSSRELLRDRKLTENSSDENVTKDQRRLQ